MTANELRAKVAELRKKGLAVLRAAEAENREVNADEQAVLDDYNQQCESLERRAVAVEKAEQAVAAATAPTERRGLPIDSVEPVRGGAEGDKRRSFSDWLSAVDSYSDHRTSPYAREEAANRLANLYSSEFRSWTDTSRPKEIRNLAMNSGVSGGYLMPEEFYTRLMQVAAPMSVVRPRATVIPSGAETLVIPSLDQTTAQAAGTPPYFGGVVVTWSGESATISATEPKFRQTKLTLNELTAYCPIGRTLLQKSVISLEALIYALFGGAVAWAEEYQFLRGDGIGKPLGILNSPCRIITSAARGSATAISFANATNVWVKVLGESQGVGVWLVSKAAEAAVLQMTGTANSVFFPTGVYTAQTDVMNAGPSGVMLYMRPVYISSKLPALDVDGDFNFFDFSKYVIADGGPPEVASSDDYLFRTNERAYRIVFRVGGAPWLNNAITLEDGSTTVSPFVSLKIQ